MMTTIDLILKLWPVWVGIFGLFVVPFTAVNSVALYRLARSEKENTDMRARILQLEKTIDNRLFDDQNGDRYVRTRVCSNERTECQKRLAATLAAIDVQLRRMEERWEAILKNIIPNLPK